MVEISIVCVLVISCIQFAKPGSVKKKQGEEKFVKKKQVNEKFGILTTVAINKLNGDIYVGGRDEVFRFSRDLKLLQQVSLSPKKGERASVVNNTDFFCSECKKEIHVLEVDLNSRLLFVCSSTVDGLCSLHKLENITDRAWFDPTMKSSFIHRNSVVRFLNPSSVSDSRTVVVGSSWSNLMSGLTSELISIRNINLDHGSALMRFRDNAHGSVVNFNRDKHFQIRFVASFVVNGFTLFLTTQTFGETKIATTLIRINNNRSKGVGLFPLTEFKFVCKHNTFIYNIATAATVGIFNTGGDNQVKKLLVTFGRRATDGTLSPDPTLGSILCVSFLDDIIAEMDVLASECTTDKSSKSLWISLPPKCQDTENFKNCSKEKMCAVCNDAGGEVDNTVLYYHDAGLITSVFFKKNEETVYIGTDTGRLIAFANEKYADPDSYNFDLTGNSSVPVQADLAFSVNDSHVYLLAGNAVYQVNLDLCLRKETCKNCVTTDGCRWCKTQCVQRSACPEGTEYTCPPVLTDINPLTGFTGILLTVNGDNFGYKPYTQGNVTVHVCGEFCRLKSWTRTRIECFVQVHTDTVDPQQCEVTVKAEDQTSRIKINGTASSADIGQNFTVKKAEVESVYPILGPRSGGTNVSITGYNLDVGSDHSVLIGNVSRCFVFSVSKNLIECTTERLHLSADGEDDTTNSSMRPLACADVLVIIGEVALPTLPVRSPQFCYWNDPDITSISPKSTIESGGLKVTVTGTNLDTIRRPRIGITVNVNGSSKSSKLETCNVEDGGSIMTCQSPNTGRVMNGSDQVSGNVWFVMDGVEKMRNFSEYYPSHSKILIFPDPQVMPFNDTESPALKPDTQLEIQGRGMKNVVSESDVIIKIGDENCRQIEIERTKLICTPVVPTGTSWLSQPVTVRIGNVRFEIGNVTFIELVKATASSNVGATFPFSTDKLIGLIVGGVVFALILLVVVVVAVFKCTDSKRHVHLSELSTSDGYQLTSTQIMQRILDSTTLEKLKGCDILIQRDLLTIGDIIGAGNFGCVHEGYIKGDNTDMIQKVAVKTLLENTTQFVDFKAFVEEALLMKNFDHPHVLCLIGITLTVDRLPLVILPFMENGDLLLYISNETQVLTVMDVLKFAIDIAEGMCYLASLKFVHRDLAARNCMLDECFRVKVADFGLCRDIYEKGYYHSDNKKKLPIRWMAIESIDKGTYSSKSDVWSLGVVIWELLTRGVTPYPGVDGWDIIHFLQLGKRLYRPWFCSHELYEVLQCCWSKDPRDRPTFQMVADQLEVMITNPHLIQQSEKKITMSECCQYRESLNCDHKYLELEHSYKNIMHQSVDSPDPDYVNQSDSHSSQKVMETDVDGTGKELVNPPDSHQYDESVVEMKGHHVKEHLVARSDVSVECLQQINNTPSTSKHQYFELE